MPKYQIVRALLDGSIPFHDLLRAFDIHPAVWDLGADLLGFVYLSRRNNYHIIVNAWLEQEHQQLVFFHELKHIIEDLPHIPYIIGVDMQRHEIEKAADQFLRETLEAYNSGK